MHERVTSNNEYFLVFETKEPPIYQKIQNLEKKKKKKKHFYGQKLFPLIIVRCTFAFCSN